MITKTELDQLIDIHDNLIDIRDPEGNGEGFLAIEPAQLEG